MATRGDRQLRRLQLRQHAGAAGATREASVSRSASARVAATAQVRSCSHSPRCTRP